MPQTLMRGIFAEREQLIQITSQSKILYGVLYSILHEVAGFDESCVFWKELNRLYKCLCEEFLEKALIGPCCGSIPSLCLLALPQCLTLRQGIKTGQGRVTSLVLVSRNLARVRFANPNMFMVPRMLVLIVLMGLYLQEADITDCSLSLPILEQLPYVYWNVMYGALMSLLTVAGVLDTSACLADA